MAVRRGSTFPVRPAAPIKGLSAGDGARCPPPPPQASFLPTFSQVGPKRCLTPPARPPPPVELVQLRGRRRGSERPSVARGPALVPEERLTGAPFGRRPLLTVITKPATRAEEVRLFRSQGAAFLISGRELLVIDGAGESCHRWSKKSP